MKNTMTARFNNENILKVDFERNLLTKIYVTMLDEDGDEVKHELSFDMPEIKVHVINSSSDDIVFSTPTYGEYGIEIRNVVIKPNESADTWGLLGTPDGNNYVLTYTCRPNNLTATVSNTVNCMQYLTFILVLNVNEEASCTITFTE